MVVLKFLLVYLPESGQTAAPVPRRQDTSGQNWDEQTSHAADRRHWPGGCNLYWWCHGWRGKTGQWEEEERGQFLPGRQQPASADHIRPHPPRQIWPDFGHKQSKWCVKSHALRVFGSKFLRVVLHYINIHWYWKIVSSQWIWDSNFIFNSINGCFIYSILSKKK